MHRGSHSVGVCVCVKGGGGGVGSITRFSPKVTWPCGSVDVATVVSIIWLVVENRLVPSDVISPDPSPSVGLLFSVSCVD